MRRITKLHPPTGVMYVEHSASQPVESLLVVDLAADENPLVLYRGVDELYVRVLGRKRLSMVMAAENRIRSAAENGLELCPATRVDLSLRVRADCKAWCCGGPFDEFVRAWSGL